MTAPEEINRRQNVSHLPRPVLNVAKLIDETEGLEIQDSDIRQQYSELAQLLQLGDIVDSHRSLKSRLLRMLRKVEHNYLLLVRCNVLTELKQYYGPEFLSNLPQEDQSLTDSDSSETGEERKTQQVHFF